MRPIKSKKVPDRIPKYADMLSAMGAEPRLRIMRLLLSANPKGLVVADIQQELEIPNSTTAATKNAVPENSAAQRFDKDCTKSMSMVRSEFDP